MAGKSAILTLKILADAKDAIKGLGDTTDKAGGLQSAVGKAAVPAAAALAGLAAAGIKAASAAAEDAAAADQLALSLRNNAGASDDAIKNTEAWISKTSKAAAVADDELRPALGTLVRATGDVGTSQDALSTALDVSAATGKDVGTVSDALAKAYAGQTGALSRLVPGLDSAVVASGDMDAIMAELARTTGGAAAEAANSTAGQMEGMKIQMAEAEEAIGGALLPAMSKLAGMLAGVAGFVQDNTTAFLIVGGIIATLATTVLVLNSAYKAYTVITKLVKAATDKQTIAQLKLNLAFLTSPVFWIIAGIVLLIAAIVYIATKTTWFQDIWETVWGAIKAATAAVVAWLSGVWETIKAPFLAVVDFFWKAIQIAWAIIVGIFNIHIAIIVGIWDLIKAPVLAVWEWIQDAISTAFQFIKSLVQKYIDIYIGIWELIKGPLEAVWNWIKSAIDTALGFIKTIIQKYIDIYVGIWEGIKTAVSAVWDGIKDAGTKALDAIKGPIDAVKRAFEKVGDAISDVIDWLGKIKMPKVVQDIIDNIGGILGKAAPTSVGTRAAVGPQARAFAAPTLSRAARSSSSAGAPIVINGALDPVAVARQIRLILQADDRRRGGVRIA